MDRMRGFSLIEMMIAVAVMAVVTAIATMAYGRYAYRSRRADAHHMLMTIANGEERWYATYNRYTDDLSKFGYDSNLPLSPHAYYELTLTVDDAAAQSYVATAIPINGQASDTCGALSIDSSGHKTPDRDDVGANANGSCW
jgi:type IV pilus assembly protein PilE